MFQGMVRRAAFNQAARRAASSRAKGGYGVQDSIMSPFGKVFTVCLAAGWFHAAYRMWSLTPKQGQR